MLAGWANDGAVRKFNRYTDRISYQVTAELQAKAFRDFKHWYEFFAKKDGEVREDIKNYIAEYIKEEEGTFIELEKNIEIYKERQQPKADNQIAAIVGKALMEYHKELIYDLKIALDLIALALIIASCWDHWL
jgi:hypothetical protein